MKAAAPPLIDKRPRATFDGSVAAVLGVSAVAAGVLLWRSSAAMPHRGVSLAPVAVAAFLAMWLAMVVAMMLPTAIPMVIAIRRVGAATGRVVSLVVALVGGYLSVWLVAGAVAFLVDVGARDVLDALSPAHQMPGMDMPAPPAQYAAAGAVLLAAGGFQLTPFAARCARACRSPFGFFARGWNGGPDIHRQALRIGLRYGGSCLGCCAGAMVVLMLVGMERVWWMAVAGAVMALQKRSSMGLRLARVLGAVCALVGLVVVVHVLVA